MEAKKAHDLKLKGMEDKVQEDQALHLTQVNELKQKVTSKSAEITELEEGLAKKGLEVSKVLQEVENMKELSVS